MRLSVINFNTRGLQLRTQKPVVHAYDTHTVKDLGDLKITEHRWVENDRMHLRVTKLASTMTSYGYTETESTALHSSPAAIPYEYIAAQVTVEEEEYHERPWDDDEWWSHELKYINRNHLTEIRQATGFIDDHRQFCLIVPDDMSFGGDSAEVRRAFFHKRGASKQVAYEMVADQTRKWTKQLHSWYTDCISYFAVMCSVCILKKVYTSDCGGYVRMNDPEKDADTEQYAKQNVIDNVCDLLIEDGFTISGRPAQGTTTYVEARRQCRIHEMRRALQSQNRGTDE